jgi:N,N'-diacetyllegionaminate synthase
MNIGNRSLGERVLIVAEIGNNHEGKLENARRLVDEAARAGADAVKFQTFKTALFTSPRDKARFERLSSFELSQAAFGQLQEQARALGLLFISTPLDLESARFLEPLVDAFKIASGDNDFFPLIAQVCATGKPLIVSTGLADLEHCRRIRAFVAEQRGHTDDLALLHCVCSYPAPPEQANLRAIPLLARELGCTVGYSDHTMGPEACLTAVALGARILEKHFTLDKNFSSFRDHQLSADPDELARIVTGVRNIERLLGQAEKKIQPCEVPNQKVARRSIVARRDLPAGHALQGEDLLWLRPAEGLPPGQEARLVGRSLRRPVVGGQPLVAEDVD